MPHASEYHDDGIYYVTAKSLAETGQYRIDSYPTRPYQTKYPPFWPAVLSLAWHIEPKFPDNLPWATLICWLNLPLSLLLYRIWLRQAEFPPGVILFLCALWVLNPYSILFSTTTLSELPFTVLVLAALIFLSKDGRRSALLAGVFGGLAFLTKTAGIAVLPAGLIYLWIRNRRPQAAWFAGAMSIALAGWILWSGAHRPKGESDLLTLYYTDYIGYFLKTTPWNEYYLIIWRNLDGILRGLGSLVLPDPEGSTIEKVLAQVLAIAGVIGAVRCMKSNPHSPFFAYGLFSLFYAFQLLVWNYQANERLVYPIAPFWLAGLFLEAKHLAGNIATVFRRTATSQKVAGAFISLAASLVVFHCVDYQWVQASQGLPHFYEDHQRRWSDSQDAIEWIRRETPPDSTFLSANDPLINLRSGRRGTAPLLPPIHWYRGDHEGIVSGLRAIPEICRSHNLGYLLLNDWDYARDIAREDHAKVMKSLRSDPSLVLVFRSGKSAVYAVQNANAASRASLWRRLESRRLPDSSR